MKKAFLILTALMLWGTSQAQLLGPITFEDGNISTVSVLDTDTGVTFSLGDNPNTIKLNASPKALKAEIPDDTDGSKGITLNFEQIRTTSSNRYLHVMLYTSAREIKIATLPSNRVFGYEEFNVPFQNQWVELVIQLNSTWTVNGLRFMPSSGGVFYVDNIFIDNNPKATSSKILDSEADVMNKVDFVAADSSITRAGGMNINYVIEGEGEFHFTYSTTPLVNSSINFKSLDGLVYFDNMRPLQVKSEGIHNKIYINGVKMINNVTARIEIYGEGTVVIPRGSRYTPLTVYSEVNQKGATNGYQQEVYNKGLGEFKNKVNSFVLKKGYMAVIAQNSDGKGVSRCYIADDHDVVVNRMPIELEGKVDFIRVTPWRYITKKGYCGGTQPSDTEKLGGTWFYTWSAERSAADNQDFVPMRHNRWWPGWDEINARTRVNHVLGHNEPNQADQANMTLPQMVEQWPDLLASGLRVGAPAYTDYYSGNDNSKNTWTFLRECEHRNLRVDFVPIHAYNGGQEKPWWVSRMSGIYNSSRRPIWLTEWNNGANWTTEGGSKTEAEQEKDITYIIAAFEEAGYVERYSVYNWVEDWRMVIRGDGSLTPAGVVYRDKHSAMAYNSDYEYVQNPIIEKGQKFLIYNKRDGILYQEGEMLKTTGTTVTTNLTDYHYWTIQYTPKIIGGYKLINCGSGQAATFQGGNLAQGFKMSNVADITTQNLSFAAYSVENTTINRPKVYYSISYYNGEYKYNYQSMDSYGDKIIGSYDMNNSNNQQWAIVPQEVFTVEDTCVYTITARLNTRLVDQQENILHASKPYNAKAQYWKLLKQANDTYIIKNLLSNKSLAVVDGKLEAVDANAEATNQQFAVSFVFRENGTSYYSITGEGDNILQITNEQYLDLATAPINPATKQLFSLLPFDEKSVIAHEDVISVMSYQVVCFPNPVIDYATFLCQLPFQASKAVLNIYTALGVRVDMQEIDANEGECSFVWHRKSLPSANYFYEIIIEELNGMGTKQSGVIYLK